MDQLYYLGLVWATTFIATYLAEKTKFTSVLFFLAFGALLFNIGLLPKQCPEILTFFSQLGIIVIMFALGFEENTNNFLANVKRSWGIAFFGALAPFLCTYAVALWFWQRQDLALICGLAMTATAVSLTMVSLKNEQLHHLPAAGGIMASAVLDDIASLIFLAIVIPLVTTGTAIDLAQVMLIIIKVIIFFSIVTFLGACIFPKSDKSAIVKYIPILNKYGIGDLLSFQNGAHTTLIMLFVALATALLGHQLGFHPAIGAYLAGLVLKEEYFNYHNGDYDYNYIHRVIDDIAYSWVGPIFFIVLGSHIDFDMSILSTVLPISIIFLFSIVVSQVLSAGLAAYYIGKFQADESLLIGLGMLGRAELAFVVMDIGYIQYNILSKEVFYTLMITTFWLNIAVPISIKIWKNARVI